MTVTLLGALVVVVLWQIWPLRRSSACFGTPAHRSFRGW